MKLKTLHEEAGVDECPICGGAGEGGFTSFHCSNPNCNNYDHKRYPAAPQGKVELYVEKSNILPDGYYSQPGILLHAWHKSKGDRFDVAVKRGDETYCTIEFFERRIEAIAEGEGSIAIDEDKMFDCMELANRYNG